MFYENGRWVMLIDYYVAAAECDVIKRTSVVQFLGAAFAGMAS